MNALHDHDADCAKVLLDTSASCTCSISDPWRIGKPEASGQPTGDPNDGRNSMGGDAHASDEGTTTTVETPESTTTVESNGSANTEDTSSEDTSANDSSSDDSSDSE